MSIRKEDAYQHALCMDLQKDRLRYAIVSKSSKKIVHQNTLEFDSFDRDTIQPLLTEEVLFYDYGAIVATGGGKRNTIIPVDLFNYSKADDIFRLNFSKPIDNLDYNRIPELGIVNIYEMPLWIKSLFVIKFPRVKLVHPVTVILKGVFDRDAWRQKIHLYFEGDSFYLLITNKNKLEYFNRFDFTNLADMVYHILFVLEQKEIDQNSADVLLYGVTNEWDLKEEFQTFFKQPVQISDEEELSDKFILAKQLLCV
ncbi:MAG: DUF3822 family protein [Crocinitomicaceae bacterium]|nr:DUF3822 family protein [Crocinitomicaceae bacterium]